MAAIDNDWERSTIQQLLFSGIQEKRRSRRWGIFFKILFVLYIVVVTTLVFIEKKSLIYDMTSQYYTAVVNLDGVIKSNKVASASNVIYALERAFKSNMAKAVILNINSPGGSPTQSRQIYFAMQHFKSIYPDKKIYAVIDDTGASGAYLVACAADQIYADKTSLVGSIGVLMNSFGFVDAIDKLGIERRLYTAGSNKGMLDPFLPRDPQQEDLILESLNAIHAIFIGDVKAGRGDRLKETPDMFSGRIWIGEQAKEIGLIDDFGDIHFVAREIVKAPFLVEYKVPNSIIDQFGMHIADGARSWFRQLMQVFSLDRDVNLAIH